MNDKIKMQMIEMFGKENLDENFVKETETRVLLAEYDKARFELKQKKLEENEKNRKNVIQNLNDKELDFIVNKYYEEIEEIFAKLKAEREKRYKKIDLEK